MPALVSVIIPTFNRQDRIISCLRSVENQTYNDIEIIVVDDGSVDDTESIVNEYSNNAVRTIKYFKQNNSGAPVARNLGFKKSKGDYIVFFDSDDLMTSDRIEKQIGKIFEEKSDANACGFYFDSLMGKTYLPKMLNIEKPIDSFLQYTLLGSTQSWMFSRDMIERVNGYDVELNCRQDVDLVFRILKFHPSVSILPVPLSIFNNHSGAERIMNNWSSVKSVTSKIKFHNKILSYITSEGRADLIIIAIKYYYRDVIPTYVKVKSFKKIVVLCRDVFHQTKRLNYVTRLKIFLFTNIYVSYITTKKLFAK